MRKLKVMLCAGALAACASSKSADRPDEEWTESTDPTATQTVETVSDPTPDVASDERRGVVAEEAREERAETAEKRAEASDRRAEAAQERAKATPAREDERADVSSAPPAGAPPDNTDINERDRDDRTLTPVDQGGAESDRKITQQIRQAVVGDDSLSFTAKNVKIITIDGKVTLRGPVKSEQERSAIGAAAKKVAGARVDNQLEVAK